MQISLSLSKPATILWQEVQLATYYLVVTAPIINPTSIDARTKMIDLRERESTEISDTNEETNIAISMELAAP